MKYLKGFLKNICKFDVRLDSFLDFNKVIKLRSDYCFVSDNLKSVVDDVKRRPYFHGELIGSYDSKNKVMKFTPTFLNKIKPFVSEKIIINDKAEWLFLCGRDVFKDSVIKYSSDDLSGVVLLLNRHEEPLGFGKVVWNSVYDKRLGKKIRSFVVYNLYDIGYVLR